MKTKRILKRIFKPKVPNDVSISIKDQRVIDAFTTNSDNTFLVSFPRTGSHWLRMVMELYFGRPSLVRVFYYRKRADYLLRHVHDIKLDVVRSHVIYLYRDPMDTIYSLLQHQKENIHNCERIIYWSDLYGRHLDKWLHREQFTTHKTVITYERLKQDLAAEFAKVTRHFSQSLDQACLAQAAAQVTQDVVKHKTRDNPQIVQLGTKYQADRRTFRERHAKLVWEVLTKDKPYLVDDFSPAGLNKGRGSYP